MTKREVLETSARRVEACLGSFSVEELVEEAWTRFGRCVDAEYVRDWIESSTRLGSVEELDERRHKCVPTD